MKEVENKKVSPFVRNIEAVGLLENFLISAVTAIITTRAFLYLTGYPILGGGKIHLAHMLLGGILMTMAIVLLLIYLNREIRYVSAVIGGVGFGLFIDELGKFITSDNNYFFQPTIALIYVIFVLAFLALRELNKRLELTSKEYISNALELVREIITHDLDAIEKKKAIHFLNRSESADSLVISLKKLVAGITPLPPEGAGFLSRSKEFFRNIYLEITHKGWFATTVVFFFVTISVINFFESIVDISSSLNFFQWGQIIFSILSAVFVFVGVYRIQKNHKRAYDMFKTAVLISIFLTQFFQFYKSQLLALTGLAFNLLILGSLQYLITQEKLRHKNQTG